MKRIFHWLDENLEEFLLVIGLIAMTLIMGVQVFCRYVLGMSLSWSEASATAVRNAFPSRSSSLLRFSRGEEKPSSKL